MPVVLFLASPMSSYVRAGVVCGRRQRREYATHRGSATLVRQTLALSESEPIQPQQLFFYDLGLLRWTCSICCFVSSNISGSRYRKARSITSRGGLAEAEFAEDAVLTEAGRQRLMTLLYDTPRELFPARIHATTLPRFCTVGAITRLVDHKLTKKHV